MEEVMSTPLPFKAVRNRQPVIVQTYKTPTDHALDRNASWHAGNIIHKSIRKTLRGNSFAITGWIFFEHERCNIYSDTPELRTQLILMSIPLKEHR